MYYSTNISPCIQHSIPTSLGGVRVLVYFRGLERQQIFQLRQGAAAVVRFSQLSYRDTGAEGCHSLINRSINQLHLVCRYPVSRYSSCLYLQALRHFVVRYWGIYRAVQASLCSLLSSGVSFSATHLIRHTTISACQSIHFRKPCYQGPIIAGIYVTVIVWKLGKPPSPRLFLPRYRSRS